MNSWHIVGANTFALYSAFVGILSAQTPVRISPIQELRSWVGPVNQPVIVRGVLTRLGRDSFVQDFSAGVMVHFEVQPRLRLGDEVEISGMPEQQSYGTVLQHAMTHLLWAGSPIAPVSVNVAQAARGDFDNQFIEVEASLESIEKQNDTTLLHVSENSQQFIAVLEDASKELPLPKLQRRSMIRLRGVCSMDVRLTHDDVPFVLLLRSGEDAEQLAGPPWWSSELLVRDALLAACLSMIFLLVRNRVRRARERAIVAEREHIAMELHDTLAQSFAGLSFQLQAVRSRLPSQLTDLDEQINVAIGMVRFSHLEARRSIAALKDRWVQPDAVAEQIRSSMERMIGTAPLLLEMEIQGEVRPVALRYASALIRVAQEAAANALQHSSARMMSISLDYQPETITLRIVDDGCGFAVDSAPRQQGFGLRGMQARMQKVHGSLEIVSVPGAGTTILAKIRSKNRWRGWS